MTGSSLRVGPAHRAGLTELGGDPAPRTGASCEGRAEEAREGGLGRAGAGRGTYCRTTVNPNVTMVNLVSQPRHCEAPPTSLRTSRNADHAPTNHSFSPFSPHRVGRVHNLEAQLPCVAMRLPVIFGAVFSVGYKTRSGCRVVACRLQAGGNNWITGVDGFFSPKHPFSTGELISSLEVSFNSGNLQVPPGGWQASVTHVDFRAAPVISSLLQTQGKNENHLSHISSEITAGEG